MNAVLERPCSELDCFGMCTSSASMPLSLVVVPHPQTGMPFLHLSKSSCFIGPISNALVSQKYFLILAIYQPSLDNLCFFNGTPVLPCGIIILVLSPSLDCKWFEQHPASLCIPPHIMPRRLLYPCMSI